MFSSFKGDACAGTGRNTPGPGCRCSTGSPWQELPPECPAGGPGCFSWHAGPADLALPTRTGTGFGPPCFPARPSWLPRPIVPSSPPPVAYCAGALGELLLDEFQDADSVTLLEGWTERLTMIGQQDKFIRAGSFRPTASLMIRAITLSNWLQGEHGIVRPGTGVVGYLIVTGKQGVDGRNAAYDVEDGEVCADIAQKDIGRCRAGTGSRCADGLGAAERPCAAAASPARPPVSHPRRTAPARA